MITFTILFTSLLGLMYVESRANYGEFTFTWNVLITPLLFALYGEIIARVLRSLKNRPTK